MAALLKQVLRQEPSRSLIAASALLFVATAAMPDRHQLADLCGSPTLEGLATAGLLQMKFVSPWQWLFGWAVMTAAMMLPLVASPVAHVIRSTVPGLRPWAVAMFLASYLAVWTLAGFALLPVAIMLRAALAPETAFASALALALIWSCSPPAQRARNSCHRLRAVSARGRNAMRDSARFGIRHAAACVRICWPWMIAPLTITQGHVATMVLITVYLFVDRLCIARRPAWGLPPAVQFLGDRIAPGGTRAGASPPVRSSVP